jgi:hypothetical protein
VKTRAILQEALAKRDVSGVGHVVTNTLLSTLPVLQSCDERQVEALVARLSEMLSLFASPHEGDPPNGAFERQLQRYAGHVDAALTLGRAVLSSLPPQATVSLLRRKHVPELLLALRDRDLTISELVAEAGVPDPTQGAKCVNALVEADLVSTIKDGRERWVSLTATGRRLSARLAADVGVSRPSPPTEDHLRQAVEKLVVRVEQLTAELAGLKTNTRLYGLPDISKSDRQALLS